MSSPVADLAWGAPQQVEPWTEADAELVLGQLGRRPRGVVGTAYRCGHGVPAVLQTAPRLEDGTPFPTLYYLTCSMLATIVSRMESEGLMAEMTHRLTEDLDLAADYQHAHDSYLATRNALGELGQAVTAGGMPDRVKCLHVLVAHSLAVGRGVNPLGDEAVDLLAEYAVKGELVCAQLPREPGADPEPEA
ncbi:DUF501 domain-containing protein [Nakamurella sp. A5-74]|uniref:DUF501 domain-containing protein n=1 Tax=Nakamurella sp. A5-74 TaxID=3158264 RepID=A0AAU8DPU9_9ACTN